LWALPKLLLGRPQSHQSTTSAASAALQKQLQGQRHRQQQRQQQQQQQEEADSGVSKAWLRQYCWLLQDLADVLLPGLEQLSPTELVDVAAGLAGLGFFPGRCQSGPMLEKSGGVLVDIDRTFLQSTASMRASNVL
jgi:hypothetical protein